jgi:hypothetical protein
MLLLSHAVDVMCPASRACRSVLKQLLDQEWASKVFSNLEQLLSPEPQAARPDAAAGPVHAVRFFVCAGMVHLLTSSRQCRVQQLISQQL